MKLKCIHNEPNDNLFTVGAIYDAEPSGLHVGQFRVINDKGNPSHVPLKGALWGFELIQDDQEESPAQSEPEFGDVLHINGEPFIFIKSSSDRYYTTINQEGVVRECDAEVFDEYAPNPYQEQRERILKRWQGKSLDNAHDTEVCIAEIRVSDLIDFVQENLLAES